MEIKINGEIRQVNAGLTVAALLAGLGIEPKNLAIERNGEFLNEHEYEISLTDGDKLEIVRFVGGG